jgi:hypothetical protein
MRTVLLAVFACLATLLPSASAGITPNPVALVVPCGSATPTLSAANLPAGIYAVTVVGACIINTNALGTTSTPCALSVAAVSTNACTANLTPCLLAVAVDSQCLSLGSAGFVNHAAGSVSAVFVDIFYPDNLGTFVVVLQQVN